MSDDIDTRDAEIATIRRDLAATQREADRLRHGLAIEGDYVCPNALERDRLRAEVAQTRDLLTRAAEAGRVTDEQIAKRAQEWETEFARLRERVAAYLTMIGRLIQEAKHHHAGKGRSLAGTGALPLGLRLLLMEIERATEGESTDGR